ncbi:hypothetical protein PMG11_05738 [Penicillium brasilianum]|uniref:Uncharacterized protein n=1 Tax=Penicillium brasilianum TaxID=104259 RepID=A0A0F7TNP9_PENBI|nr:hypothetical protein PMG11_05738 [Penicillium brasilianum]
MHAVQSSSTLHPPTHNQPSPITPDQLLIHIHSPRSDTKTITWSPRQNQSRSTRLTSLSKNSEPTSTPRHWSSLPTQPRPPSLWRIILRDFFCKHRTDPRTRALAALSHPSPSADFPAPSGSLLASC